MKMNLSTIAAALFLLASSAMLNAHGRYILPSHTQLSGEDVQHVTLLASISNDFFHPDMPLMNNGGGQVNDFLAGVFKYIEPSVTLPDGSIDKDLQWHAFSRQSIADVSLDLSGTYRVSLVQKPMPLITFKTEDGSAARVFGSKDKVPAGATDIVYRVTTSRVDTFITHNNASLVALKATGSGLEMTGETHPNDLFVGETAHFQLLLNGEPVDEKTEVNITHGGTRYRNQRNIMKKETGSLGKFDVVFAQAGMYLLEVELTTKGSQGSGVDFNHDSLYVTLEVFPE
jgi:hypothetical protein